MQNYTSLKFGVGGYVLQSFLANWEYWQKFVLELHVKLQFDNAFFLEVMRVSTGSLIVAASAFYCHAPR